METGVKKREWVKDAAIIFLAVLLVLTFFSNTIMNRSLPEVATAAVTGGSIVAKVRGTGVVTAVGKQQVKAKETRTIRSVMIRAGQEVKAGDVLFVLGAGDETALEQARKTLRELQTEYQRTSVNLPIFDYSSYNSAIASARTALDRASQERSQAEIKRNNLINDPATRAALENYERAAAEVERLESQYESEKQARISQLEMELNGQYASRQLAIDGKDPGGAENQYYYALSVYDQANYNLTIAQQEFNSKPWDTALEDALKQASDECGVAAANLESARIAWENVQNEVIAAAAPYDIRISELEAELEAVYNDSLYYDMVQTMINQRDAYYQSYVSLAGSIEEEYQRTVYNEEDARNTLQAAYDSLYIAQVRNAQNLESSHVELDSISENIRITQEKIKSLAGDDENVITANAAGTIDTIDCTAGDTVLKDALLCTIVVPDMGHTLSFTVTNEQAQRLRLGDTATVSNYYWGNSVTATLSNIRTDPKNPTTNKILTFDLEGDVTAGAEMTISVGQKSANYDLIVPNSAIKSDTNGRFVLAVQVRNSPLGNRYTARRVSVEVLANDDSNSAVVAELTNGDYVITTSSAPIASGDLVRIADNA